MPEFTLFIDGMHCGSCIRRVTQALSSVPDVRVEEVNQPVQLWAEAHFALMRTYEGRDLTGEKYLLTNVSQEPMVLSEEEFDRDGGDVVAVSIETHNLAPGESSNVFVIRDGSSPWRH